MHRVAKLALSIDKLAIFHAVLVKKSLLVGHESRATTKSTNATTRNVA